MLTAPIILFGIFANIPAAASIRITQLRIPTISGVKFAYPKGVRLK